MDDLVEREFREGKRWVPEYLANSMPDETFAMTYNEAVDEANRNMLRGVVNDGLDKVIRGHFRRNP